MVEVKNKHLLELQNGGFSKNNIFAALLRRTRGFFGIGVHESRQVPYLNWEHGDAHTYPTGGNVHYDLYNGMSNGRFMGQEYKSFIDHINCEGVGAQTAVIALPSRSSLRAVKVTITRPEKGLTFNLTTAHGTKLPQDSVIVTVTRKVPPTAGNVCGCITTTEDVTKTFREMFTATSTATNASGSEGTTDVKTDVTYQEPSDIAPAQLLGWGAFSDDNIIAIEIEARSAIGEYVGASSDLIVVEVASVPTLSDDTTPAVIGECNIRVSASYEVVEKPIFEWIANGTV